MTNRYHYNQIINDIKRKNFSQRIDFFDFGFEGIFRSPSPRPRVVAAAKRLPPPIISI